jgi:hypothetical protein
MLVIHIQHIEFSKAISNFSKPQIGCEQFLMDKKGINHDL